MELPLPPAHVHPSKQNRLSIALQLPCCASSCYLTHSGLHQGVQPSLWRVQVAGDPLHPHQLCEQASVSGEAQDVVEGEGRGAGLGLGPLTRVLEHVLCGADVWHHCLVHERTKSFRLGVNDREARDDGGNVIQKKRKS